MAKEKIGGIDDIDQVEESVDEDFASFAGRATLHGLRYVTDGGSRVVRRIFWALILLLMLVFYTMLVTGSVQRYLTYESMTVIKHTPRETLQFPAVTICSQRFLRASFLDSLHPNLSTTVSALMSGKERLSHLPPEVLKVLTEQTLFGAVTNGLDPIDEFLLYCEIHGFEFNCSKNFVRTYSKMAACYTFQPPEHYEEFGPVVSQATGFVLGLSKYSLHVHFENLYLRGKKHTFPLYKVD